MANEIRIRYPLLPVLTLDAEYDPSTDTTISAPGLANYPVVDSSHHLPVWVDRDRATGEPYLLYITAHSTTATTATVTKDHEGTTATTVPSGTLVHHGETIRDRPAPWTRVNHTAANLTYASTTWGDLSASLDIALSPVFVGDIVEVGWCFSWNNDAASGFFDVASLVSAAVVNVWSLDGAEGASGQGIQGAWGPPSTYQSPSGVLSREIVAGDLESGVLTLRCRRRNSSATTTINAGANVPFSWMARNLGPAANTNPSF